MYLIGCKRFVKLTRIFMKVKNKSVKLIDSYPNKPSSVVQNKLFD